MCQPIWWRTAQQRELQGLWRHENRKQEKVLTLVCNRMRGGSFPLAEHLFLISQEEGPDLLLSLGSKSPSEDPPGLILCLWNSPEQDTQGKCMRSGKGNSAWSSALPPGNLWLQDILCWCSDLNSSGWIFLPSYHWFPTLIHERTFLSVMWQTSPCKMK